MAISTRETETPLLQDTVTGAIDHAGLPARRSSSGGWRSAAFVIGVEVAERFANCGIGSNLVSYLSGPVGESTVAAAANVNAWSGIGSLLPLFGAFVADAFLGRYRTIIFSSLIYIMGLGLLTLSAFLSHHMKPNAKKDTTSFSSSSSGSSLWVEALFFFSLYLVAIGQGGHKPCVQAFGADQFDGEDPNESKSRSSFFNWWYLSFSVGINLALLVVVYIQDNVSWALGFGVPCIFMVISLVVFLLGTKTYRYGIKRQGVNPFVRIGKVFIAAFRNRGYALEEEEEKTDQSRFLNKALLGPKVSDSEEVMRYICTRNDVEEAEALLRLIPIWITTMGYSVSFAQSATFFTKQGATMNRALFPGFEVPAASIQLFIGISIVLSILIYDRVFVPIARSITRKPSGITMLQRIGSGMLLSVFLMIIAAIVESKRLETAQEYIIGENVGMLSIWWLVPQYLILGVSDALTMVGLQEFFYDQVPSDLRSLGLSLYLSVVGVGNLLSCFLVTVTDEISRGEDGISWLANDLNRAHLDYFYLLLAGLNAFGFAAFVYFSKSYVYNTAK